MLCAVVTPVICPLVSVCSKFLLNLPVAKPLESSLRSQFLGLRGMRVELFIPTTVELSDCSGDGGCFRPIPCGLFLSGTVSFVIKDSAAVSASAADDTTYFMICIMVSSGPCHLGMASFSDRNMCALDLLLDLDSLLKLTSEWTAGTVFLAL